MNTTNYSLTFKASGQVVTYIHDEQGPRFEVPGEGDSVKTVLITDPEATELTLSMIDS